MTELPIYGAGREGVLTVADGQLNGVVPDTSYTRHVGRKLYELTDQLGSARMVISDRKLSDITGPMGAVGNFRADVVNYANVYPFGMEQPGRYLGSDLYRYGYNGMEKDSSSGSERYTTYFRVYDPRVGRWLSVDPITHSWESPYAAMGNNPIAMTDPLGAQTDSTNIEETEKQASKLPVFKGEEVTTYAWLGDYLSGIPKALKNTAVGIWDMGTTFLGGMDGFLEASGKTQRLVMEGDIDQLPGVWGLSSDQLAQEGRKWDAVSTNVSQWWNRPAGAHWNDVKATLSDPQFYADLTVNGALMAAGGGGGAGRVGSVGRGVAISREIGIAEGVGVAGKISTPEELAIRMQELQSGQVPRRMAGSYVNHGITQYSDGLQLNFRGPAAKGFDWEHIFERHSSAGKIAQHRTNGTIFEGLTENDIMHRVQSAWDVRKRIATQESKGVTRIQYSGKDPINGREIIMWYNESAQIVETAYWGNW